MRCFLLLGLAVIATMALHSAAGANTVIVNRDTGRVIWMNLSGQALEVAGYTLLSPSGGFVPSRWLSIADNYDADSGGTLDAANNWLLLPSNAFSLAEITSGTTTIPLAMAIDLGTPWKPGNPEDVTFEYLDVRANDVLTGGVFFLETIPGDYNANGAVEQGDLDLVLLNWGRAAAPPPSGWLSDLPIGSIDQGELDRVLLNWGTVSPFALSPAAGTPLNAASVPEPAAGLLSVIAVLAISLTRGSGGARLRRR